MLTAKSTIGVKYDPKYWANIAGAMAALQLPLLAALGTKNNVVSCMSYHSNKFSLTNMTANIGLTGISFEKVNAYTFYLNYGMLNFALQQLNYLHRMFARTVCVLLWLHMGGRVSQRLLKMRRLNLLNTPTLVQTWVAFFLLVEIPTHL